ncbi:MAG: leucyl aminopeptidase family protein, partial [Stellaceae bacterium]
MPIALVTAAAQSVPITPVTPESLSEALSAFSEFERRWVASLGFKAEPGATALLPAPTGGLGRVLVGWNPKEAIWTLGGLPEALPQGQYTLDARVDPTSATRMALGWALGAYAFSRYKAAARAPAELVWPAEADRAEAERLARAIHLTRDLINTPAEEMGPAELALAAEQLAAEQGARCTVLVGDDLLKHNYPMIHAVGRGSARAPRLIDLAWGDPRAPKLTLVGKGVCFDSGGLDLKT